METNIEQTLVAVVIETLGLQQDKSTFSSETKLLGAIPELDSLMITKLLGQIEKTFNIRIEDDELEGSLFKTIGTLTRFIDSKVGQRK